MVRFLHIGRKSEPVEIMRVPKGHSHPGTICSAELGSKSYSGVEGGIRTPESFWDIGLAVLRLTRLGHLHFSTREGDLLFKTLVCPDGGGFRRRTIDGVGRRLRRRVSEPSSDPEEEVAVLRFLLTYIIVIWTTRRGHGPAYRLCLRDYTGSCQIADRQDQLGYK